MTLSQYDFILKIDMSDLVWLIYFLFDKCICQIIYKKTGKHIKITNFDHWQRSRKNVFDILCTFVSVFCYNLIIFRKLKCYYYK